MIGGVTIWEVIWTDGLPHLPGFPHLPDLLAPPQRPCKQADQKRLSLRSTSRKSTLNLTQITKERAISRKKLDSETDRSERYRIRKYVTDLGRTASEVNEHFSSQATRSEDEHLILLKL